MRCVFKGAVSAWLLIRLALLFCPPVLADPTVAPAATALTVDIPAQSLAQALESFAHQTGLQYIFVSGVVNDQLTQGAPAGLAPAEALSRLLTGTGLRPEFLNARIVRIVSDTPPQAHDPPPPPLEEVLVLAHRIPKPHIAPPTVKEQQTLDAANADIEGHIAREHLLYEHPTLDQYVQTVAERLLAVDQTDAGAVHVRVIKGLQANAFALSNGSTYVTTALLTSLDDESQLATVLGHEIAHYTNSDALRALRSTTLRESAAYTTGTLLNVTLALMTPQKSVYDSLAISQKSMEVWARMGVSGYSRDLERGADQGGIRRTIAAGYDPIGALAALQHLTEQTPALPAAQPSFYASHPRLEDRMASYRDLLAGELVAAAGIGDRRPAEYRTQLGELPLDQVSIFINAGALDAAEQLLGAEVAIADSGRAEFLKGEIANNRIPRTAATTERALAAYERAVTLPGAPASAYRKAGMLYRLKGNSEAAAQFFQRYLDHAPTAVDVPLVRLYLDELHAAPMPGVPLLVPDSKPIAAVKTVGVLPVHVDEAIPNEDKVASMLEEEIIARLQRGGFTVVPPSAMRTIRASGGASIAGAYDPVTGLPIPERMEALQEFSTHEYTMQHPVDATLSIAIVRHQANFESGAANWDGVRERMTSVTSTALHEIVLGSDLHADVPALSLSVSLVNSRGVTLYTGFGGLLVLEYPTLSGKLATYDLSTAGPESGLENPSLLSRAVTASLDRLVTGTAPDKPLFFALSSPSESARTPSVTLEELLRDHKGLAIAPLELPLLSVEATERIQARYHQLLAAKFAALGFNVADSEDCDGRWGAERVAGGGFYDRFSGQLDGAKLTAARARVMAVLHKQCDVSYVLRPIVVPRRAPSREGYANWDGVTESVTGSGTYIFNKSTLNPSRTFTADLDALSLDLQMIDDTGAVLSEGLGGIQLTKHVRHGHVVPVPEAAFFSNPARDSGAISAALLGLVQQPNQH